MDAAGVIATYVLDGDRPLTAESNGNTTFYLYGLGGIGEETNAWSYSLPDGTNTPRQLSSLSGEITLAARYTPWGDTLDTFGSGNFTFGYLGGVLDATTGLLYVGNGQYYDPATGRFLTRNVYPNSPNPYVPWNPLGVILGPLALVSLFYTRKKKGSKTGTFLVLLIVLGGVGMTLAACAPAPTPPSGSFNTASPAMPAQTQTPVPTNPGTIPATPTGTPPAPIETPVYGCPVHIYDYEDNEEYKRRIKDEFGIILGGSFYATDEWPSVHIQIVYGALSRINDALGGNLKSRLGVESVFHHITSTTGEYGGYTRSTNSIEFTLADRFPYHLIYHEMGHLLDNTQGEKYTSSLETTIVYTDYPDRTGDRVMGGMPYNRIDGKGYVLLGLYDPCGYTVDAELHPASKDGNNSGEEWGDLFANYVAGNFNNLPEGRAKYRWVHYQLFGS